jgi:hypothetical protein
MYSKTCLCGTIFKTYVEKQKFCSKQCVGRYVTAVKYLGKKLSVEHRKNISRAHSDVSGTKNPRWKGEKASLCAIHIWIRTRKGNASNYPCVDCGKVAHHWSNKDHKHTRDLKDYQPRCSLCHDRYDYKINNKKYGRKSVARSSDGRYAKNK